MKKSKRTSSAEDDLERRRKLSFSQAEGHAELPRPLKLEEMPEAFRVDLWSSIFTQMWGEHKYSFEYRIEPLAKWLWVRHFHNPLDEFPGPDKFMEFIKPIFLNSLFYEVFDLLEKILQHQNCPHNLDGYVRYHLENHQMAYYLDTSGLAFFAPQATPQEGEAIRTALSDVAESGIDGAQTHLRQAAEEIRRKKYEGAVRESIHAVECVAKVISDDENATLGSALKILEKKKLLPHKQLKDILSKLYKYASDEKGVRHSLVFKGSANVGLEEALFMFGACASFCGYLCRKQRKIDSANDQ